MDMYVRIMGDLKRGPDDNPTVAIILCAQKDEFVVRYSVLHENEQMSRVATSWSSRQRKSYESSWSASLEPLCWDNKVASAAAGKLRWLAAEARQFPSVKLYRATSQEPTAVSNRASSLRSEGLMLL